MAVNIKEILARIADQPQKPKFKIGAQIVGDVVDSLGREGFLPERLVEREKSQKVVVEGAKVYPEISLEEEWKRQAQIIFERVGKPLRMSEGECRGQLPSRFPERLSSYDELGLTVPLIIPQFKGFPWLEVIEAAQLGISDYLRERVKELALWPDPRGIILPDKPYATWAQNGTRYVCRIPVDVRNELQPDERGGTRWDGAGLAILRPDLVKSVWWDLIGDQVGSDLLPYLCWWGVRPRFGCHWVDSAHPSVRALVCGSQTEA